MRPLLARAAPALAVAAAFAYGAASTWRTWGSLYVDSGRDWELARLLAGGALLYRDARSFYGPVAPYLNAALFELLGVHLDVLVGAGLATAALMAAALYRMARELGLSRPVATAVSAAFPFLGAFAQLQAVSIFNFVLPYTFAATYGITAATWSAALLLRHHRTGRATPLLASTLLLAVALLCKLEAGFPALAAHAAFLAARARALRPVHGGAYALALLALALPLAWLSAAVGPALWTENLGGAVNAGSRHYVRLVLGLDAIGAAAPRAGLSALALAGALAAAWGASKASAPGVRRSVVAAAALAVLALYASLGLWVTFRALPLLAAALVAVHSVRLAVGRGHAPEERSALVAWAFAAGCLARLPLQASPYHYGFFLLPGALVALAALVSRAAPAWLGVPPGARGAFAAVCVALLAGASLHVARITRTWASRSDTELVTQRGRMRVPSSWPDVALLDRLGRRPPGATLLTVPQGAGYVFMSGLLAADPMLVFLPMDVPDPAADEALLARLRARPPDLVLWTEHDLRPDFGFRGFGLDYAPRTAGWIRRAYAPLGPPVGAMTLLARDGSAAP